MLLSRNDEGSKANKVKNETKLLNMDPLCGAKIGINGQKV